ncbi:MAG TPA: phosphotransferase [Micromonosporaceae bacterium]|nr:phosphotransferase [Micromonosporaceae bacterium]
MAYTDRVRSALRAAWHRPPDRLTPLAAASTTRGFLGCVGDQRYVARLVTAGGRAAVEAGLAAVEHLAARGLPVGRPVRAANGALAVDAPDGAVALLREVPGRPLDAGDPLDQQWWGDLLGRVHRETAGFEHPGLLRWHWVRPDVPYLDLEPWLRPAVADAVAAVTRLTVTDQLTYGVLHGDPLACAFRMDLDTGRTGLVGWGPAATGPLVYDVAAAVIDAGGPEAAADLLDGYASAGPVGRDELDAALPVLMRFRWAVQADWCARRLRTCGGPSVEADGVGEERALLAAARRALAAAG